MVRILMLLSLIIATVMVITPFCGVKGQTSADTAVQVWVSNTWDIGNGFSNVTLTWKDRAGLSSYQVSRYLPSSTVATTFWTVLISGLPAGTAGVMRSWTTTVTTGIEYDYQVIGIGTPVSYGYVQVGVNLPLVETRGSLLLLVDSRFNVSLASEISTLVQDLSLDGWVVHRRDVLSSWPATRIRDLINATSLTVTPALKTIYVFGHVAVPYSGQIAPDGHSTHSGAWPADTYYASGGLGWTDRTVNTTKASTQPALVPNRNVPGDGKFDQGYMSVTGLGAPIYEIGRVDMFNMWGFTKNETTLLRQYLVRAHKWKLGQTVVPQAAVMVDSFGYFSGEAFASSGWRAYSSLIKGNVTSLPTTGIFPALATSSWMFAYGCGGGSYDAASGVGTSANFNANPSNAVFFMSFGSWFGDFDIGNNFLRAPLASSGLTLTNSWAGRPHSWYQHLGIGYNIGYAFKISSSNGVAVRPYYYPLGSSAGGVHQALMGDPSVRLHPVIPPSAVTVSQPTAGGAVTLTWAASPASGVTYYVYRSRVNPVDDTITISERIAASLTATSYVHTPTVAGRFIYVVKAVVLQVTGSGSYWNPSLGAASSAITITASASTASKASSSSTAATTAAASSSTASTTTTKSSSTGTSTPVASSSSSTSGSASTINDGEDKTTEDTNTSEPSSSSSSSSVSMGVIGGAVGGGAAVVLIIGASICVWKRKQLAQATTNLELAQRDTSAA